METKIAKINRTEENTFLILNLDNIDFKIVLTEDNPNNIKTVFNNLLKKLKKGLFEFKLNDNKEDLYNHICVEYINQLNSELNTIYQELKDYDLLKSDDTN